VSMASAPFMAWVPFLAAVLVGISPFLSGYSFVLRLTG